METALRAHPREPRTAAIAGAGPVGLLTALALQARGLSPSVASLEPEDHPRIRLLRHAGIPYYRGQNPPPADLVFEASGSSQAASAVFRWLAPCGVLVFIGAPDHDIALPPLRLLVDNLTVSGTVNAAPHHYRLAFIDLARIPRPLLEALIERRPFADWSSSLSAASIAPKLIHSL
jgi:threonine dehydrogenase-like Zn-dependent dehydrogenase